MALGSEYDMDRVLEKLELAGWQHIEQLLSAAKSEGMLGRSLAQAILKQCCWSRLLNQQQQLEICHLNGQGTEDAAVSGPSQQKVHDVFT